MPNNLKVVEKLHHIWNSGELDLIPEVYSETFVVHWPKGFKDNESRGLEGVRKTIESVRSAIPDWHEAVLDVVVGEDKVVTRYTSTGTHLGVYAGVEPTGRKISLDEISIYRLESGKVVEQWCLSDDVSTLLTLGILKEAPSF